jgi:hypothetical protein
MSTVKAVRWSCFYGVEGAVGNETIGVDGGVDVIVGAVLVKAAFVESSVCVGSICVIDVDVIVEAVCVGAAVVESRAPLVTERSLLC